MNNFNDTNPKNKSEYIYFISLLVKNSGLFGILLTFYK